MMFFNSIFTDGTVTATARSITTERLPLRAALS